MSIRTLYAKAVRATRAPRNTAVLVIEATPANANDPSELFELVLGQQTLLRTLRDALDMILEDPPNA